jgi:hypothetical protein
MKKQTAFLVLAIFSLLLCGFTLRPPAADSMEKVFTFRVTTEIQSNGSGSVQLEAILSPDLAALLYSSSNDFSPQEFCSTAESSTSMFQFTPTTENDGIQCTAVVSFEDLEELADIMEDKGLGASVQRLEIQNERLYYDLRINLSGSESSQYYTYENFWVLVLPGTPGDNNADTVSGNTLTWDLTHSTGWASLTAECSIPKAESAIPESESSIIAGGSSGIASTTIAIIATVTVSCCCCTILLLAAVLVFLLLRRKNKQPAAARYSSDTIILNG